MEYIGGYIMFRLIKSLWMVGIPFLLSVFMVIRHSVVMLFICILAHFVILKISPIFKQYENLVMFIIVAFSSIPINIYIFNRLNVIWRLLDSFFLIEFLRGALCYVVLLSIEEVVMGILTRVIWRNQHEFLS